MKDAKDIISSCRHCLFYEMQGRRGGQCRQLGVPVKGCWRSCSLAVSPFAATNWRDLERIVALSPPVFELAKHELGKHELAQQEVEVQGDANFQPIEV